MLFPASANKATCTTTKQTHQAAPADMIGFVQQGGITMLFCKEHAADFDSALLSIGTDSILEM